jgi:hypothetical protein
MYELSRQQASTRYWIGIARVWHCTAYVYSYLDRSIAVFTIIFAIDPLWSGWGRAFECLRYLNEGIASAPLPAPHILFITIVQPSPALLMHTSRTFSLTMYRDLGMMAPTQLIAHKAHGLRTDPRGVVIPS